MARQAWTGLVGAALVALLCAVPVRASTTWTEIGDAGDLPSTVQVVVGTGPLTAIMGEIPVSQKWPLPTIVDVDMFQFYALGGDFSATTVGSRSSTPTDMDTRLFLFDSAGHGVKFSDDTSTSMYGATISTTLGAGFYWIAISTYDYQPVSGTDPMFPECNTPLTMGCPGNVMDPYPGVGTLTSWAHSANFDRGPYTISLEGAAFGPPLPPVPEPTTLAFLGVALVGLALILRRTHRT